MKKALAPNAKNDNTLQIDAISKELENVKVAFEILSHGKKDPIGHLFVQFHIVFNIKMEDLRHETRLVAGGDIMEAPATITYANVMSREMIRIVLMIPAINDFEIKLHNI